MGTDEYQRYFYEVLSDGRTAFWTDDGRFSRQLPPTSVGQSRVLSASRSLVGDFVALGTEDGHVSLQQVRFTPRYEDQKLVDLDLSVRDRGYVAIDPLARPIRQVAYEETDGRQTVLAVPAVDTVLVWRTDDEGGEHRAELKTRDGERVTRVRIGRSDTAVAATEKGNLYHWELAPEVRLTEVAHVSEEEVTALEYVLGNITLIVGDARGNLSGWFRVREKEDDADPHFVKAHSYPGQGVAIAAIGASTRDKSFVTSGSDGSLVMRHMTSERSVIAFPATGEPVDAVLLTPKMDGIIVKQSDGRVARYEISAPHPDSSFRALFGKVWYEGYSQPEYVWQSTGGTDDFETKFSLIPLVFGTIKGTRLRPDLRHPDRGDGSALHLAVHAPDAQGPREAHGRDHGRAAERRGRFHRRPVARVPGRARDRARADDARAAAALRDAGHLRVGLPAEDVPGPPPAGDGAGAHPPAAPRRSRRGVAAGPRVRRGVLLRRLPPLAQRAP